VVVVVVEEEAARAVEATIIKDMNNRMRWITTLMMEIRKVMMTTMTTPMTLETSTNYLGTIIIFLFLPIKDYFYSPADRRNDLAFP